jgi:hypothetical protein
MQRPQEAPTDINFRDIAEKRRSEFFPLSRVVLFDEFQLPLNRQRN